MTATAVAQVIHVGPRCIFALTGEIDIETAEGVTSFAREALANTEVTDVVIDASEVTFIDSIGVGALLDIRDAARARGAGVRIGGASPNVAKVLTILGWRGT